MEVRSTNENAYFAASNSEKGFYSYYGECFDTPRVKRVFAVKGGPGTGKSRFLREVAVYAEARGWTGEYIYCSSDPDSLDGVILSKGEDCMALLDATAPHVYEPGHPGVREELVNLGAFWDRKKLTAHAKQIETLTHQKSEAYRRAYRYLTSDGYMMRIKSALSSPYLRKDAIRSYAEKQMRDIPNGTGYESRPALIRSVGMQGEVLFDTYYATAQKTLFLEDCYGSAQVFLEAIGSLAMEKNLKIRVSHDPVYPDRLDGIFLEESRRAFMLLPPDTELTPTRVLSLRRFVEVGKMRLVRGRIRFAERMRQAMREGALEALREVKEAHFELEKLYTQAMDFSAKEEFTKIFCEGLFDLQKE